MFVIYWIILRMMESYELQKRFNSKLPLYITEKNDRHTQQNDRSVGFVWFDHFGDNNCNKNDHTNYEDYNDSNNFDDTPNW
jgi:hypothetical protein